MVTMAYLSIAGLEKLEASRYRTKQVAHSNRSTLCRGCRGNLRDLAIVSFDLCSQRGTVLATQQCHLCHGSNTRQCLATKAERANMLQIINLCHFASGMAC